jgi:hypothetical protein
MDTYEYLSPARAAGGLDLDFGLGWSLAASVVGLLVVGVGAGLMTYHFALGWFISHMGKETVDGVVDSAERHLTRRTERRHGRERRRRILADAGASKEGPRHLAR